jgi:hypothetical protein
MRWPRAGALEKSNNDNYEFVKKSSPANLAH